MRYGQDWQKMECFQGVDLFDSFVTSWKIKDSGFYIEAELSLWPESKYYTKPKAKEYTCYKKGVMKFLNYKSMKGLLLMSEVEPTIDSDGSIDYGNVEHFFKTQNEFEIHGEFGQVVISGAEFCFEIYA